MTNEERYREDWMTDDQWECANMVADLQYGFHHITGKIKPCGSGIKVSLHNLRAATFDFDGLTRLVVMAHDRCIRAEITPSSPCRLGLLLHKRKGRDGAMHNRHPDLETAIAATR